jgi:hypothetical protein
MNKNRQRLNIDNQDQIFAEFKEKLGVMSLTSFVIATAYELTNGLGTSADPRKRGISNPSSRACMNSYIYQ